MKDGERIAGATNAMLVVNDLRGFDSGQYQVRVSNPTGDRLSQPAQIKVSFDPFPYVGIRNVPEAAFTNGPTSANTHRDVWQFFYGINETNRTGRYARMEQFTNLWQAAGLEGWSPIGSPTQVAGHNSSGTPVTALGASIPAGGVFLNPGAAPDGGVSLAFQAEIAGYYAITGRLSRLALDASGDGVCWYVDAGAISAMSGLVPNTGTNANLNLDGIYLNRGELLHLILSPATDPVGDLTGVELEVRLTEPDPNSEPGILQSPQNVAVLAGQNAAFSTQVDGTPEPGFQWQRSSNNGATWEALVEGAEFTGVNSTNLQLYAVALELNGQLFRLEALNPAGSALSSPARLTVTDGPTAPVMSLEPDGLMLLSGNAALLRAAASGTGPFYYQWWKDALLLVDQTNSTLVLDTTSASDAGGYFVVVSNAVGSVTSQVATITVDQPPPPPILGLAVSEESASVALLGLGGSRWKVQRSGDLSGYWDTLEAVDLDPAGEGWLVDSNSPSAMAFYRAKLDIPPTLPEIEVQPQAWTYYLGSDAVLSVSTSGAGPLHYQWWQNGLALAGQTNQILFLPGVTTNQAGVYQVVVSNFYGAVTSQSILLQVSEELAPENLVQNGSFEIPPVPGSHLYLNSGDAFAGGWTVESTTTFFSLYDNADPYVPGLWHPTTAGSQFVYLADNVAASVLKQDLASPLSASTDYSLSFLQSGFLTARSYPAQVTVTITPSGSAVPVFSQTFALPDGAPWTRQHALFRVPADGFYDLRLISTSGFVANVDDVRVEPTTSIAIVNSSFEDPVIAGGVNWLTGISDWVTSGSVGVSLVNGILPPAPDGVQLGWMSSGGSILQTLPDAVQMDTTYYLSIQVGGRTDGYNPGTSYTVSLLAGTNVLTSIVPVAPAPGTWTNLTASCTITNPVVVGQPLGVRIETTANDFVFDDVQLHATGP